MLKISDQLFVDILINQQPIPPTNGLFSSLFIYEGNGFPFPSLEINLHDTLGSLSSQLALTEGNEISVMIGTSENDPFLRYRQFRYFSSKQHPGTAGPTIQIFAIYNAPTFIQKSTRESFEGNSSQVLKILAETSNLTYDGPEDFNGRSPDDSQIWRNVGKTRTAFARKIAMHGWVSEGSCMSYVITSDGDLIYRNLNDVINVDPQTIQDAFVQNISERDTSIYKKHKVREAKDRSDAGMSNAWVNYGHLRVNHQATGEQKILDKIAVPTGADKFPINQKVSDLIKQARIDYGPIDGDNVHEHYEEAIYQNIRLLSMFNQNMSILVDSPSEVDLFDPILYRQEDLDETDVKNSDQYILFGKTIAIIQGSTYCERLEIGRHEVTMPSDDLKTSLDTPANNISSGFSLGSIGSGFKNVLDIARTSLSIVNDAKVTLANLRKNGPQLIGQALLNGAMTSLRTTSMSFLNDLKINNGSGQNDGSALAGAFGSLRDAYDSTRQIYGQIAKPLADLNGLLATASPNLRRSVINSLPLDLNSLLGSAVSTITHTQSVNKMLGVVSSIGGLSGLSKLPEIVGLTSNLERIPGFPSLAAMPGTGPLGIPGYPGNSYSDFHNIPGTAFPGLPPYQGVSGVFGSNLSLPSLPFSTNLLAPFSQVLYSQQQLVTSVNNLMDLTQNLRLRTPEVANVLNIQTYNQTLQPPLNSNFSLYQQAVVDSLKGIKIQGPLPEYDLPKGENLHETLLNIMQEAKVADLDINSCTAISSAWSAQ